MRDDQPDEPDQPGDRDGGRGGERRRDHHDQPESGDVEAEALRLDVADLDHVEEATNGPERRHRDRDRWERQANVVPAGRPESPEDPRVDLAEGLGTLLLQERLDRGEERGDGDAGEDEAGRGAAPEARTPEPVRQPDADERADEGRDRNRELERSRRAVGDGDRRTEPGARRRAQQVGVGEGVAEHAPGTRLPRPRAPRRPARRRSPSAAAGLPGSAPAVRTCRAVRCRTRRATGRRSRRRSGRGRPAARSGRPRRARPRRARSPGLGRSGGDRGRCGSRGVRLRRRRIRDLFEQVDHPRTPALRRRRRPAARRRRLRRP